MNGVTLIEPPIAIHQRDGRTVIFRDAQRLAEWLDGLYDAILDPRRREGGKTWRSRSAQLHDIEVLLFALVEESSGETPAISGDLRMRCVRFIGRYREIVPIFEPRFSRVPSERPVVQ
jgi:hypothetical protein